MDCVSDLASASLIEPLALTFVESVRPPCCHLSTQLRIGLLDPSRSCFNVASRSYRSLPLVCIPLVFGPALCLLSIRSVRERGTRDLDLAGEDDNRILLAGRAEVALRLPGAGRADALLLSGLGTMREKTTIASSSSFSSSLPSSSTRTRPL